MYHMIEVNPSGYENISCLLEMEGVYQLGLKEIKLCQDLSAGPSFIVCTGVCLLVNIALLFLFHLQ